MVMGENLVMKKGKEEDNQEIYYPRFMCGVKFFYVEILIKNYLCKQILF